MRIHIQYLLIFGAIIISCTKNNSSSDHPTQTVNKYNITKALITDFQWLNNPQSYVLEDHSLKVSVDKGTDFFNNPEDRSVVGSAPLLYKEVEGDFVAKALVQPDFSAQWNAVSMMVYLDSLHWIKFAFENSDATGPSIVTVVTKETSDDANGVVLNNEKMIWLAIARNDHIYSMHWSFDGENFKMARLTAMKDQPTVKIGLEMQSPVGDHATHLIHYFEIEEKTVNNLRNIDE